MQEITIKEIKKGTYFKFNNSETSPVWVRDYYDPSSKQYWVYKFDDVCHGKLVKGTRKVFIDFPF